MNHRFPRTLLLARRSSLSAVERGVKQRQSHRDADSIDHDSHYSHYKRNRRIGTEDRLQYGKSEEADSRRTAYQRRNSSIGSGVLLEAITVYEIDRHEAHHDYDKRHNRQFQVTGQHLTVGLHNRYKQGSRQCIVKHDLVEFLGIVTVEDAFFARNESGQHHHHNRHDGI